jgi:hypothetical protein
MRRKCITRFNLNKNKFLIYSRINKNKNQPLIYDQNNDFTDSKFSWNISLCNKQINKS